MIFGCFTACVRVFLFYWDEWVRNECFVFGVIVIGMFGAFCLSI